MLERWIGAPTWVLGVVMGAVFGVGMGAFFLVQASSVSGAVLGAVVAGTLFGAVMGPWTSRYRRGAVTAVGGRTDALATATRGLRWRAAAPRSEADRQARVQLARHHLGILERQKVWSTVLFTGISLVAASFALTRSPWWWLEVVLFAVVLVATGLQRHRLRRIIATGG